MNKINFRGPVVLAVLDGVGLSSKIEGNALAYARIDFLRECFSEYPTVALEASGEAVGIPAGVMGNSEVGHNAIGAGQIIKQGIEKVNAAIESGEVFATEGWKKAMARAKNGATLHFSGIFSDGGVHSDIRHLKKLVEKANSEGISRIRLHCIFDGRDVAPQSEPKFIREIEDFFSKFDGCDYRIADGAGRMVATADRYMSDWNMVKIGYDAMRYGRADREFRTAEEAIVAFREEDPEMQDQYLPQFVIVDDESKPVGVIEEGDAIIYIDFRADRAIEIAMAFTYEDFPYFDRGTDGNRRPDILFVGMSEYNSDTHVPQYQLVPPVKIENPLNVILGENGITQYAVSETVKFGHITYYFNGNSYKKAEGEEHAEVPSYDRPFYECPWMKSLEIADKVIEACDNFKFIRCNFPGGDMVGHFGEMEPTVIALESIDIALARIAKKVDEMGGMLIVTADHGNAEELVDEKGEKKTSHTLNPVPCVFYDNTENKTKYEVVPIHDMGLSNIAPSIATLLGIENIPETWRKSLIHVI